jgi:tetratricopeptide (TPR) repeat protein
MAQQGGVRRPFGVPLLLLALLAAGHALAADPMPRTEAELAERVSAGLAEEAYRALKAVHKNHAGEAWYDYLLALAALETRRTKEAIDRLSRYIEQNPLQDPPQFQLGRAFEQAGRTDRAIAQYRRIYDTTAFEPSRDRARNELARLGAMPVIPVGEPGGGQPPQQEPEFDPEENALVAEGYAGTGYDTNANSGVDADRYFQYDLVREEKNSDSFYLTLGGDLEHAKAFSERLAWRSGVSGSARFNPSAHFADTQYASVQTQLRWSGPRQRLTAGLAYSVGLYDDTEPDSKYPLTRTDQALAAGAKLELLTPVVLTSIGAEGARVRFPDAPLRDVNTFFLRTEVTTPPDEAARWVPTVALFTGFEEELREDSPFGRAMWGASAGLKRFLTGNLNVEGGLEVAQSIFDEAFTEPEHREDNRVGGEVFMHWRPDEGSRWTFSGGVRHTTNMSNEPLFDFSRTVVGVEVSGIWGKKKKG